MLKITEDIKSWYAINLIEGEGVGTAYEYYAKLRKLKRFINSIKRPRRILIAGLPEKYGLSMDFFLLGQMLKAETVVIDERSYALERARKALWTLRSKKLLGDINVVFLKAHITAQFDTHTFAKREFDIALSSEVLQRLDGLQQSYISNLNEVAKNFAIFVPNRGNESHAKLSGLKSVYLDELLKHCQEGTSGMSIYDYGYVDMPPFPPGLTRSREKRERVAERPLETFLMRGLQTYSLCEHIIPKFVQEKIAHIVYVMASTNDL